MLEKLRHLEEGISTVRKLQIPTWFCNLETLEEISLIKQAKREHLPVFCALVGSALINQDHPLFWNAIEQGIIDRIVLDSPLIIPFLEAAVKEGKLSAVNMKTITCLSAMESS